MFHIEIICRDSRLDDTTRCPDSRSWNHITTSSSDGEPVRIFVDDKGVLLYLLTTKGAKRRVGTTVKDGIEGVRCRISRSASSNVQTTSVTKGGRINSTLSCPASGCQALVLLQTNLLCDQVQISFTILRFMIAHINWRELNSYTMSKRNPVFNVIVR